jgi:exodeoxyribonuclease V beta subunit
MVEACNRIFGGDFFTDPEAGFREVSCGRPDFRAVAPPGEEAPVQLIHLLGADKAPDSTTYQAALGAFIAREIHRLVEGGALRVGEETPEPIRYRDVHVLTRSAYEGRQVGEALARLGIPHAFYRQEGLFATDEARDLLALLRAVVAPEDTSRRLSAWLTPFFSVPLRDLACCAQLPDSHPLVARLLEWHRQAGEGRLGGLLRALARDSGLGRRLLVDQQGDRALTTYLHLLDLLLEEAHRSPCTLEEMVSRLQAMVAGRRPRGEERDLQPATGERDAVQILTMHKAKGLEAAVVFLAGGFTGPPAKAWDLKVYRREGRRHAHLGQPLGTIAEAVEREALEEDQRLLYVAVTRARARVYLPYFGPPPRADDGHNRKCKGAYRQLAQRLEALRAAPDGMPERLFRYLQEPCEPLAEVGPEGSERSWCPDPRLLLTEEPDPAPWLRLQRQRRGAFVTSYTRLHRHRAAAVEGDELSVFHGEAGHPRPLARDDELPPGRASGIFLHHLLETADRQAALAAVDAGSWARRPEVAAFLEGLRAAHGIEPRFLAAAHRLAFAALRTSISQHGLDLPGGFAEAERQQTEMEFLFPIPEPTHPALQSAGEAEPSGSGEASTSSSVCDPPPYRARRGYVQGVVDLVFEHRGRTFFLDWKSDLLPDYSGPALRRHVEERYQLQAQLYALAVVRLLQISGPDGYAQKFGGLCYCFVRGLEGERPDAGLYFHRPEWGQVVAWERELRERERW